MAENSVESELEWSNRALDSTDDILVAMETLLATLRAFEDVLRQQEMSKASSSDYCDNFCQALMHYAGSRNSVEHGLPLLEVYCLSINCFAAARSHLTAESDSVALVLKRLALSCFELLLSVPENDIPYEAWVQFHNSVQIAHDNLMQFGSTDLQALLQITGEGGAWSNIILTALLTGQPTIPEEVNAYIGLEGEGFMEMRVKHLEKIGETAKAVVLAKACSECCLISNQATFRQTYVSLLCHLLPNEEAITEISRLDCKDVLEITSNLETEGDENTAFILCTTFLTQRLQQQSDYCSGELTLLWSKLQRRIDPSSESLLERCLQLGAIANTVQHLLYLVRVIQAETEELGLASSVELCVKALQLPKHNDSESRISVVKTVSCLLQDDLEVLRACLLTEFLLGPCQEVFCRLQELFLHPDQKYDQENGLIPNSLRCELLLTLKAYWPFDPEFWDWKTLKHHCIRLLGMTPEAEEEEVEEKQETANHEAQRKMDMCEESHHQHVDVIEEGQSDNGPSESLVTQRESPMKKHKFYCRFCEKEVSGTQIFPHSTRHAEGKNHPCPVCMETFNSRKVLVPHMKEHIHAFASSHKRFDTDNLHKMMDPEDDIEPGEINVDPSLVLHDESIHDPDILHHTVQQGKDDAENITFDYIDFHFNLQNRDEYPCPGTNCSKTFKHAKYLYVHLKSEHQGDENVKHFHEMRDKREKCIFCRRHLVSSYHHRKHRRAHYNDRPYTCVVIGCGAQFPTSNELATHKQTHGYQLNFQCELEGCYVTFSDLAQLYHHEAQHFRDAAFSCTSPECKKFYLSKKEFVEHLSTHGMTFSKEDFEIRRKAEAKLLKGDAVGPKRSGDLRGGSEGMGGDEDGGGPTSSNCPSLHASSCKGPKGMITSVAVCFDGSKFTCGFEKCGMTFSRARDVQRHFKCAHPEHLKLENKEDRHDKERDSKSKGLKVKTEQTSRQNVKCEPSSQFPLQGGEKENKDSRLNYNEAMNSASLSQNDALKEILIGLSKLDLNSVGAHIGPLEGSNAAHVPYYKAIMARSPVVVLQKRPPHVSGENVKDQEAEVTDDGNISGIESLANAKPYICRIEGCDFRTAQSYSLRRHLVIMHSYSVGQARNLTSLKATSFKPYACQICSKSHRQKSVLRTHYIQMHKLNEAAIERITCASVKHEDSEVELKDKQSSPQWLKRVPLMKRVVHSRQQRYQKRKAAIMRRENRKDFDNHSPSDEEDEVEEETENGAKNDMNEQKDEKGDGTSRVRTTRRHVAKSNLCYILNRFNKPFHCVVKDCNAAFSTQGGLVRHLQLVHRYNRSQLVLDKDSDMHQDPDSRKDTVKKKPVSNSDEPQPQYKCRFANCTASYHLKSSLVRHTRELHFQPPEPIHCTYEGCTRVFNHASALKKHILYTHCEYYDSLVLRLQSTHKKSIGECQKDPLDASNSPHKVELDVPTSQLETQDSETEEAAESGKMNEEQITEETKKNRKPRNFKVDSFILRSHEEALQMCQDRCLPVAYPCMIQDCDSVVKYLGSLHRHYLKVHRVNKEDYFKNAEKLFLNAEQLEEIIQRKSAQPTMPAACTSNGVHKMEYQAEQEHPDGTPVPMSLNSIKSEMLDEQDHNPLHFPEEELPSVERSVLVGADDVLYGDPSTGGHNEEPAPTIQNAYSQEERLKYQNTTPPLPSLAVDLSPPSSLRITSEEIVQDTSCSKDCGKMMNESVTLSSPPVRQPLKRKNELSEHPSNLMDSQPHLLPPSTFDIATYKPMGFESSFLKFIQDTSPKDQVSNPIKRRDPFRRSCSIKENNQLGVCLTRSRRTRSPPLKRSAMTEDFTSVQNMKSIMDKALAGCGDLAIKQLQYLRPVVVLERPICTTDLPGLFPPDANNKLLLGS